MSYFKRLKTKWAVQTNAQLIVIFIVFAITGSTAVKIAEPLLKLLSIYPAQFENIPLGNGIYWFLRLFIVFPIYQVLLMFFGALFFQFKFFWEFEKKMLKRMGFKRFFEQDS